MDELGRTQAKPTKVWIMTRHQTIKEDLAGVFPRCPVASLATDTAREASGTKNQMVAQIIKQIPCSVWSRTRLG